MFPYDYYLSRFLQTLSVVLTPYVSLGIIRPILAMLTIEAPNLGLLPVVTCLLQFKNCKFKNKYAITLGITVFVTALQLTLPIIVASLNQPVLAYSQLEPSQHAMLVSMSRKSPLVPNCVENTYFAAHESKIDVVHLTQTRPSDTVYDPELPQYDRPFLDEFKLPSSSKTNDTIFQGVNPTDICKGDDDFTTYNYATLTNDGGQEVFLVYNISCSRNVSIETSTRYHTKFAFGLRSYEQMKHNAGRNYRNLVRRPQITRMALDMSSPSGDTYSIMFRNVDRDKMRELLTRAITSRIYLPDNTLGVEIVQNFKYDTYFRTSDLKTSKAIVILAVLIFLMNRYILANSSINYAAWGWQEYVLASLQDYGHCQDSDSRASKVIATANYEARHIGLYIEKLAVKAVAVKPLSNKQIAKMPINGRLLKGVIEAELEYVVVEDDTYQDQNTAIINRLLCVLDDADYNIVSPDGTPDTIEMLRGCQGMKIPANVRELPYLLYLPHRNAAKKFDEMQLFSLAGAIANGLFRGQQMYCSECKKILSQCDKKQKSAEKLHELTSAAVNNSSHDKQAGLDCTSSDAAVTVGVEILDYTQIGTGNFNASEVPVPTNPVLLGTTGSATEQCTPPAESHCTAVSSPVSVDTEVMLSLQANERQQIIPGTEKMVANNEPHYVAIESHTDESKIMTTIAEADDSEIAASDQHVTGDATSVGDEIRVCGRSDGTGSVNKVFTRCLAGTTVTEFDLSEAETEEVDTRRPKTSIPPASLQAEDSTGLRRQVLNLAANSIRRTFTRSCLKMKRNTWTSTIKRMSKLNYKVAPTDCTTHAVCHYRYDVFRASQYRYYMVWVSLLTARITCYGPPNLKRRVRLKQT